MPLTARSRPRVSDNVCPCKRRRPFLSSIRVRQTARRAPTRTDTQVEIVVAVTPRVLIAAAVPPEDEKMRNSGTLQPPAPSSLEAMIQEADRADQLAAARLNQNRAAQLSSTATPVQNNAAIPNNAVVQNTAATTNNNIIVPLSEIETPPAFVPAPRSLMNSAATQTGAGNAVTTSGAAAQSVPANMPTN